MEPYGHSPWSSAQADKKRGDDRWDHRLLMGEGGWDGGVYLFIQTYLMQ